MKISEIAKYPTCIDRDGFSPGSTGAHESVLRSYHIVRKVKDLLQRGTPTDVVLELIEEMENKP